MAIKFDELLEALDPSLDEFEEDLNSMWIIIPTERRYDDLTASDYNEFISKYGTFNSRQECWDKIDKLAPDRWDAFIPLRIEGVNESLNESMTKEELNAKAFIIRYLNRNEYSKIASLLNDFDFKLTEDPDTTGYVDLNTKHIVLNRNLSMDDAIKSILDTLREKSFKQALKDPKFIQQMKDENKEIERLLREKEKNESLNEAIDSEKVYNFIADEDIDYQTAIDIFPNVDLNTLCEYFECDEQIEYPSDLIDIVGVNPNEILDVILELASNNDVDEFIETFNEYVKESLNEDIDPTKKEFFNKMYRKPYFEILDVCQGLDEDGNPHDIPKEWVEEWFERFIKRVYG